MKQQSHFSVESLIRRLIEDSISDLKSKPSIAEKIDVQLEIPKLKSYGDVSTNIALRLSGLLKRKSLELAEELVSCMRRRLHCSEEYTSTIREIEVKPPGFINFWLTDKVLYETLKCISAMGPRYGCCDLGNGKRLLLEFVSANPTGPLTIAHARQAAFGDALARILEFAGYKITREYYINDEGVQMELLGGSIRARYLQLFGKKQDIPEGGYVGSYVADIAHKIKSQFGDRFLNNGQSSIGFFQEYGYKEILNWIKKDLEDFGVHFDIWYSQRELSASGKIEKALEFLKQKNCVYDSEGALWFRSTSFSDDKDRVVRKSDGNYTYLAPDIAYHRDKLQRGFDRLINIWGPDHHGYVPRIISAIQALGFKKDIVDVLIVQHVTLYRDGKVVSISTRGGRFVTLRELMGEVGKDACRFFLLMRKRDSHLDFDLDLAKRQSPENPVYYIQYAHARICSIMNFKSESQLDLDSVKLDLTLLKNSEEIALMKCLRQFPLIVEMAVEDLEPYKLIPYLLELAKSFHIFYDRHRVVGEDKGLTKARLFLIECVRFVVSTGLNLLGITAPVKM